MILACGVLGWLAFSPSRTTRIRLFAFMAVILTIVFWYVQCAP